MSKLKFKVGDEVVISREGEFKYPDGSYKPRNTKGIITYACGAGYEVRWPQGLIVGYREDDLELVATHQPVDTISKLVTLASENNLDLVFSGTSPSSDYVKVYTEDDGEFQVKCLDELEQLINTLKVLDSLRSVDYTPKGVKEKKFPKIQIPIYGKGLSCKEVESLFKQLIDYGYTVDEGEDLGDFINVLTDKYGGYLSINNTDNSIFGYCKSDSKITVQPEDLTFFLVGLNKG